MLKLKIFLIFLKIGFFTFGGGIAMIPLMQKYLVEKYCLLTNKEFLDAVAIGYATPGPVAITATFAGYKIAGFLGAVLSTSGIVLPSFLTMSILIKSYKKIKNKSIDFILRGIILGVIGLIFYITLNLGIYTLDNLKSLILFVFIFFIIYKFKIDYTIGIFLSAILGYLLL
jgi:chromate transporter